MYAIVEVNNKQYKVAPNEQLLIEGCLNQRKQGLSLDEVLLSAKGKQVNLGRPYLKGCKVECQIIAQVKGEKKIAFKCRRRKSSQSKKGQRQDLILLKVKEIKCS